VGALLERDAAIGVVTAAIDSAREGSGSVVLVTGDAGIGKTALVREAVARTGVPVVWAYCDALTTPVPGGPLHDIALADPEALHGLTDGNSLEARNRLLGWLGGGPRVVVVEDVHWADDFTADVLRTVARRLTPCPAVLIVTSRPQSARAGAELVQSLRAMAATRVVSLPPLTPGAVSAMASGSGHSAEDAYRLTSGNPFLVTELLAAQQVLPDSVTASVELRMAALSDAGRAAVERAAVTPRRERLALFAGLDAGVDDAVAAGLLVVDEGYVSFRHELVRLAAAAGLPPSRAQARHREVIERLGPDAPPAVLAHHADAAGDIDAAVTWHAVAAEQAERRGATRQAVDHLARAVQLIDDGARGELRDLLRRWSRAAAVAVGDAAACGPARRVVALGDDDPVRRADDMSWLSRVVTSDTETALWLDRALSELRGQGQTRERATAVAYRAADLMLARRLEQSVVAADEALRTAEHADDVKSAVWALQARGCALLLRGDEAGVADLQRAIDLAVAAGLVREAAHAHMNLVSAAGEACRYDLVASCSDAALAYATEHDAEAQASYLRAWLARCAFEQGRWSEATGWIDQVLDPGGASIVPATVLAQSLRGRLRARRGDPGAWPVLVAAYDLARETELLQRLVPAVAARAEARWLRGDVDDASDGLASTYRMAWDLNHSWAIGELGFWMWRHGHLDEIDQRAAAPYARHVAGDVTGAAATWSALGRPYDAAEAWSDSTDEADVRRAHETFVSLGARPAAARAARRLRDMGVRSIPRGRYGAAKSHPQGLTARETDVLGLVRDGLTDSEIAVRLHLSTKTVSHHVSAVLRKVGVASRRQLSRSPADVG
jgi:DNA-binding CsgD family transcriptional regulator